MGHFLSIIYNGVAAAGYYSDGFCHTEGRRVFGTDAATDFL